MRLNKRGDTEMSRRKQIVIRQYFENLHFNELKYLHEADKLLATYDLTK